jgi:hypothetical protein
VTLITDIAPYLVLVAEVLKPDWDHDVLADSLLAADIAGWTPGRVLREFVNLVTSEDGSPRDLKRAAAVPLAPRETGTRASRVPEYAAFRAQLAAMPPLPEHRKDGAR